MNISALADHRRTSQESRRPRTSTNGSRTTGRSLDGAWSSADSTARPVARDQTYHLIKARKMWTASCLVIKLAVQYLLSDQTQSIIQICSNLFCACHLNKSFVNDDCVFQIEIIWGFRREIADFLDKKSINVRIRPI